MSSLTIDHPEGDSPTSEDPGAAGLSSLTRRLLSGGAWVVAGKGVGAMASVGANALLARLLVPSDVGIYFLVLSLVVTSAMVANGGLNYGVVRFVAAALGQGDAAKARSAIVRSLVIGWVGALLVSALFASDAGRFIAETLFGSPAMRDVMPFAALWVGCFAMQNLVAEIHRGLHDIRGATLVGGVISSVLIVSWFGIVAATGRRLSLREVILASAASVALVTLMSVLLLWRRVARFPTNGHVAVSELIRAAAPLWIATITLYLISQVDLWVVGATLPSISVAIYGAAARLVALLSMPLLIVNGVLPPFIANLHVRGETRRLQRILQSAATIAALPALIVVIILVCFGGGVLSFVYGEFYRGGALILALLSLGQMVNVLAGSCGMTLMMTGHYNTMMLIGMFSAALTLGLALWLVRVFGAPGVAGAAAAGLMTQNVLMWSLVRRKTGLWTHASLFVAMAAADRERRRPNSGKGH